MIYEALVYGVWFMYDSKSGFVWRGIGEKWRRTALTPGKTGYYTINVGGRAHGAHRVIWRIVHGSWPKYEIDHINGNPGDNRLVNLQDVTGQHNRMNTRLKLKLTRWGW